MNKFSIIIPVFNNWAFTEACLKSIFSLTSYKQDDFEVVVVDDDSEDGTALKIAEFISLHSNLKYFHNDRNSGFAATCNHGAARAGGELLIFLNNDTRVTRDWDKHLVETIERDREIWMAGAKCIYPDGTIQHAGVAFPDYFQYHLNHIYKNTPSFFPLADYEKDYRCVTGACFIIRKTDFELLHGFDENFRNGFEDVDLCLRIVQRGKRIVFQPCCEIIHYESKSDGRFDDAGGNKDILLERWMTKILPDKHEHFKNDLEYAEKNGKLKKIEDFSSNFKNKRLKIIGKQISVNANEMVIRPSSSPARIMIPGQKAEHGLHLLIAGEIKSLSAGNLHIKYMTGQEKYYSDAKCFTKRIYPGHNIFHFTLNSVYLFGDLMLEFSSFRDDVTLFRSGIYSFIENPPRIKTSVALLYHIDSNPELFSEFQHSLNGTELKNMQVKILVTATDNESLAELPDFDPERFELTKTACKYSDLPNIYNEFIKKSCCKYCISMNESVHINSADIERFVELMETDPGIGVLFNGSQGFFPFYDDFYSPERKNAGLTLSKIKDIPIAFRSSAWDDAGGFNTQSCYYFNLDLYLAILSGGNWRDFKLEGIRASTFTNYSEYPKEVKHRLEEMRELIFARHARFLMNLFALQSRLLNSTRQGKVRHQAGKNGSDPHSTLMGSVKVHFNHYINKHFKKF